ncbi:MULTISPECIES: helix-turn-helix domain-containing protein [Nocardia]|uniref:helix-turn-helix domain-containing protein n=1 Tax=Nocardia TaxID=1817 RepID=UPI00189436AC|nr:MULTISPECIES: helix-turn-helix transcriptional regulator [Nocardia]MBF6216226.1 helix-turn-helix transcriptional regulator [Nocardia puris]MBF6574097.1 helix-turn-helix transcriptional regulator [Nocardia farcinica]
MSQGTLSSTGERVSPYSRRLHLGDALRRLRQERDLSIQQVAKEVGMDRTLLTRIETGQRRVAADVSMTIAEYLGIEQHSSTWQTFYALARDAAQSGWWESRAFRGLSPRQALPADLEAGASRIRWYDFALIPGLLQSPAYLRARHSAAVTADHSADNPVEIRARERRQQEALAPGGPRIEAVVEETVIRRLMVPQPAMREQLAHLLDLIDNHAQIDIRILPVGGELLGLRAPRSPWQLYDFAADDPPLAIVESLTDDVLLRDHSEIAHHDKLWQRLHHIALPPQESRQLISEAATRLDKEQRK